MALDPQTLFADDPVAPPAGVSRYPADARVRLWGSGIVALFSCTAALVGRSHALPRFAGAIVGGVLLIWAIWLFVLAVVQRGVNYTMTSQRLEVEKGVLAKRYESLELWRVRDVVLEQTVLERMRSSGRITIYSGDQTAPVLQIGPVAGARALYDRLRSAIVTARRKL